MRWPGDEQFECPKCHCRLSDADMFNFKSCPGCETRFAGDFQPIEMPPPPLPKAPVRLPGRDEENLKGFLGCVGSAVLSLGFAMVAVAATMPEARWHVYRVACAASVIFGVWRGYRHRGTLLIRIAVGIGSALGILVLFVAALVIKEPRIIFGGRG